MILTRQQAQSLRDQLVLLGWRIVQEQSDGQFLVMQIDDTATDSDAYFEIAYLGRIDMHLGISIRTREGCFGSVCLENPDVLRALRVIMGMLL